jgi:hypothetical protein
MVAENAETTTNNQNVAISMFNVLAGIFVMTPESGVCPTGHARSICMYCQPDPA